MGGTNKQRQRIPVVANDDGSLSVLTDDVAVAMAAAGAAQRGGLSASFRRSKPKHAHLGRLEIRVIARGEVAS